MIRVEPYVSHVTVNRMPIMHEVRRRPLICTPASFPSPVGSCLCAAAAMLGVLPAVKGSVQAFCLWPHATAMLQKTCTVPVLFVLLSMLLLALDLAYSSMSSPKSCLCYNLAWMSTGLVWQCDASTSSALLTEGAYQDKTVNIDESILQRPVCKVAKRFWCLCMSARPL